jgi:hypothetical protein
VARTRSVLILRLTPTKLRWLLYPLGTDHPQKTQPFYCCVRVCWGSRVIATQLLHWRAGCLATDSARTIENTAPVLLAACLFEHVYLATGFFWLHSLMLSANPSQYPNGTRGFCPGGKRLEPEAGHPHSDWAVGMCGAVCPPPAYVIGARCLIKCGDEFMVHASPPNILKRLLKC